LSTKTWKVHPLHVVIVEILEKKGSMADDELFEALKSIYKDIEFNDLNKALMKMEIAGKIVVSTLMKKKRLVELKKD